MTAQLHITVLIIHTLKTNRFTWRFPRPLQFLQISFSVCGNQQLVEIKWLIFRIDLTSSLNLINTEGNQNYLLPFFFFVIDLSHVLLNFFSSFFFSFLVSFLFLFFFLSVLRFLSSFLSFSQILIFFHYWNFAMSTHKEWQRDLKHNHYFLRSDRFLAATWPSLLSAPRLSSSWNPSATKKNLSTKCQ